MTRKTVNIHVIILLMISSLAYAQSKPQKDKKPNVLFILADDLGINALNCYGNEIVESPNIDKLYAQGMHFTNGYSNDPTCAPSRASIMSGQYVPRHRVYRVTDRFKKQPKTLEHMKYLPPENNRVKGSGTGLGLDKITLAEALKANGYTTAAYGKWHLGHEALGIPNQGFDQGYEIIGHYHIKTSPEHHIQQDSLYASDFVTERIIDFMKESVKKGQPFFAYVPYYLVHKPLEPKPEYLKYFKEKLKNYPGIGADETKVLAMIKSLDENVGQLLTAVDDLGIEEETIIVFVSDNGHYKTESNIFTQPYRGVKGQTYEGGIRVPYIFKWKNHIPAHAISTEPVIHVDIYPTLLGLTHTPVPQNYPLDGEDISPILLNKKTEAERDALIWEYTNYTRYNTKKKTFASEWVNVIQMDGFKMTEVIESNSYYLYNLNQDPYESKEVSKDYPEMMDKMKKRLEQWKDEVGYEKPVKNPDYKYRQ